MKKIIFSLCILLLISTSIISYFSINTNFKKNISNKEDNMGQIMLLRENNHNNPILIIKND